MAILTSRWFRLLVSAGLLAIVIWLADWRAIQDVLRNVDMRWVSTAFALAAFDRLLLNYRWQLLLAARGLAVRFMPLLRVQLASNFLGSFLPSSLGVDAIRIAALCRAGLPTSEVIATTLVDRATIVVATLLFGAATVLALAGTRLPDNLRWVVLITTISVVAMCIGVLLPAVRTWVKGRLVGLLPERLHVLVRDVAISALAYRREFRLLGSVAALTGVVFVVRILFAKALAMACGADVTIIDLLLVIPILWIVVMVPITVGGIGLQDAGYVALMALLGVPAAIAVSMSVIEHVVARAVSLPGAFFLADVAGPANAKSGIDPQAKSE